MADLTPAELGALVRRIRKAQGLRQDELAGAAMVGVRFIVDLEAGKPTAQLGKGRAVGLLTQDRHGELGFRYDAEWLSAPAARLLSASLPLRPEPFSSRACRPFFGGLLPKEGQRTAVAQVLGISAANDFALLASGGGMWPVRSSSFRPAKRRGAKRGPSPRAS